MEPDPAQRWKLLIDLAVDAILLGDASGTIIEANRQACLLTGYPVEALVGRNIEFLFSAAERARVPLDYPALLAGLTVRNNRYLTRQDGTTVPIEMNTKRMPDGTYQSFLRDMNDRVKAEQELRLSEEKFAKAFKTSPDAVNITRISDGTYLEINEGFTAMTGYTSDDVVGRSALPGDLGIWVDPQDRENVVQELRRTGMVRGHEARFRAKDGSEVIGVMSARRIEILGEPCLLSITRDITEKKRTEQALAHAQKLEALGVLAGGIAHDFNNLLTGLFGYLSVSRKQLPEGHPAQTSLDKALGVFDRAQALSYQLLTFSKGGAPVKKVLNLHRLLQATTGFALSGSNLRAEVVTEPGLWPCEADGHQIGQVLDNLLLNARHAMPDGGSVTVTAGNVAEGEALPPPLVPGPYVKVEVRDQGPGIPPEVLPRIFDPFFTTKQTGSGLGLATAFSILKRHGGHILARSEPGRGTTVGFYLPAVPGGVAPGEALEVSPGAEAPQRVLVVDDESFILEVAQGLLGERGHRVVTARDGDEAVDQMRRALASGEGFDLVLLDLTIPGGEGGLRVLERLRALDPGLRAVASSGYSDDPVMAEPRRFGFQASLAKPYSDEALARVLASMTGRLPPGAAGGSLSG